MNLHCIAQNVLDTAASEQSIAYVKKQTKADGSVFASFYTCDWETLQSRPLPESAYLHLKFGAAGALAAGPDGNVFTARAAQLPDGGCAVLQPGARLTLVRPDGTAGAALQLSYQDAPACDIAFAGGSLWFTVPRKNAVVEFSLQTHQNVLRVGGSGVFPGAAGLRSLRQGLAVCCAATHEVKFLHMGSLTLDEETLPFKRAPERYYEVFHRRFVWQGNALFALEGGADVV